MKVGGAKLSNQHWNFFDNECILTIISNKLNGEKSNETFVERRFEFIGKFYSPSKMIDHF